jgi:putative endonuclease
LAEVAWFVYIVECMDKTLYTGVTTDVERRVREHNSSDRGAKYTRSRRPVRLVYIEIVNGKQEAFRREREIKTMSRAQKLDLMRETK